jgi:hypothetical protein
MGKLAMKHELLALLFLGALLALAYHLAEAAVYRHFFPLSRFFQDYWYLPSLALPGLLLGLLAARLGFYRPRSSLLDNGAASAILAAILLLTLDAPHACGAMCF